MRITLKSGIFLLAVIFALGALVFELADQNQYKGKLVVVFIDAGDADSAFIKFPDGKTALIDGGDTDSLKPIHDVLNKYNVKKIDYMINSHQHDDHLGTFYRLAKVYKVGGFYAPESPIENESLDKLNEALKAKKIPKNIIQKGSVICEGDVKLEVVSPDGDEYGDENNYSAIILMTYKNHKFLFTGDAQSYAENSAVLDGYIPKCDVLKVAHHGSDTSSSYYFLENVSPEYAVISTGDTHENRPSEDLLEIFSELGTKCFVTRDDGNITFVSDGENLEVKTKKGD